MFAPVMTDDSDDARQPRRRQRGGPRKATPERLEKAAWHYLERYATSAANLRRVLLRRVQRSAQWHGTDPDEGAEAVDEIVAKLQRLGLLDDAAYAEGRAVTLHRAGHGMQAIRARLAQKGVDADTIEHALERLREEAADPELGAALRYARKRRLGPYRTTGRDANRERDLAALCRKGFGPDIARAIVDTDDRAALEAEADIQPGPIG